MANCGGCSDQVARQGEEGGACADPGGGLAGSIAPERVEAVRAKRHVLGRLARRDWRRAKLCVL
jgi:hypothetical protein